MYIRRIYSGNRTSDFAFRIISPKKLTGTTPTTLTIVHDEDNATPLRSADPKTPSTPRITRSR